MTYQNPKAIYACVNNGEMYAPKEIADRSVCIGGDIGEVLKELDGNQAWCVSEKIDSQEENGLIKGSCIYYRL